jgi:ABC-type uncharacterized transport system substrate-binding protein
MKPTLAARILSILFLAGLTVLAIQVNLSKPRVMILQSYDPNYAWTRDVDEGIRRIAKNWTDKTVTWHYMNTKQLSDPDSLRYAGIVARRAIDRFAPNVLIAVDDLAQNLAAKYYVDREGMSIVFSGVNGRIDQYGYNDAANVTGIYERKPLQAVKDLIMTLERTEGDVDSEPSILYLMDPSPSMARDRALVEGFDWAPIRFKGAYVARDYMDWQARVSELRSDDVDYLLVANYRKLPRAQRSREFPRPEEIMGWTERQSAVPVIGVNVFNVEDGAAIAVGASPFEQGEVAARLAERIIDEGLIARDVDQVYNRHYVVAMNAKACEERGLRLPQIYETFARTTFTFIEGEP